jgi:GalNAc-alpha-(1->4)-GalNAc-alpha-(1->3)-diNAcBac-PP-undecaprenol alpha-1,4-N-acetyl-D-galactosaminyltransferase
MFFCWCEGVDRQNRSIPSPPPGILTLIALSSRFNHLKSNNSNNSDKGPKRLVGVIHSLDGGGAERVMSRLMGELAARGHDMHLVTLDDGTRDRYPLDDTVRRVPLNLMAQSTGIISAIRNTGRRIRSLRAALVQIRPDAVLSFCDRNNILTILATRTTGIPTVVSERSDPAQQSLGRFWNTMRDQTYRRADAVIAQTDAAARYLRNRTGRSVEVIASAVDRPGEIVDFDTRWAHQTILGVGRYETEKGFDRLIDSFVKVAPQHPDWRLRLVGDGSLRGELKSQAARSGFGDRILVDGWQNPIAFAYNLASLFVLPSRYEGFPAALLEAMASGMPVIAMDCPSGPAAIVRNNLDGMLVDNDLDSLAAAMSAMMGDAAFARQCGAQATAVVDRFGWPSMVDAYERTLILVCKNRALKNPRTQS